MQINPELFSSWPPWVAIALIVALLILRGPLVSLLDRTRRVRLPWGTSLDAGGQPRQVAPASSLLPKDVKPDGPGRDPRAATDELLRGIPRTDYTTLKERQIEGALKDLGIGQDPEQSVRALVAVAAVAAVSTEFERLYSFIWGSQIRTLQILNAAPTPTVQLRPFYDQAASAFPDAYKAYTFEQWLDFVSRQELIEFKHDQALITLKGRAFLMYLAHEGKPFERAG